MKKRKPGGQPNNKNRAVSLDDKKLKRLVNLTPGQANALTELGGTTTGLNLLLNAAVGAAPIIRTFQVDDGAWYSVWLSGEGAERETDAGGTSEYAAMLIAAYEWLIDLAHQRHMERKQQEIRIMKNDYLHMGFRIAVIENLLSPVGGNLRERAIAVIESGEAASLVAADRAKTRLDVDGADE